MYGGWGAPIKRTQILKHFYTPRYSMNRSTYQPVRSSDLVKFATSSPKLVNAYLKDLLRSYVGVRFDHRSLKRHSTASQQMPPFLPPNVLR